ncbi:MAG: peptide-methionine (S)-S-oxide reductase MsrA [Acidobacteria bacterium]|nr:peptide-methionine (S)-S-oxide reductase MsrA [Acidobacteriota bacterium]
MRLRTRVAVLTVVLGLIGCGPGADKLPAARGKGSADMEKRDEARFRSATFAGGCFWCTEGIFERLRGVERVVSGYSGGHVERPTYEQVSGGDTGHAEAVEITYDPAVISYAELLEVFWKTHDPTTPNRQGYDVGPQYRSVVFYHDGEQKALAEELKARLEAERIWDRPIVTEIVPRGVFWPAEDYHQDYYDRNPEKAYCRSVITPKIEKFRKIFRDKIKGTG